MSQAYISHLASIPLETFGDTGVRIAVIGCGEWDVIPFYKGTGKHVTDIPSSSSASKLDLTGPVTIQKRLVSREISTQIPLGRPSEHLT